MTFHTAGKSEFGKLMKKLFAILLTLVLVLMMGASAFAVDMLLLKFIQGLPVVGVIGGAANPVYYSKVMKYVQMKYRKRYLLKQKGATSNEISV